MSRTSGIAGSVRLGIRDEVTAAELDTAIAVRLLRFDNESRKAEAQLIAFEVGKVFGGESTSTLSTP